MGRTYAQDPQGWKRPWGLWGAGLRLKEQKGPGLPPTPGLRVQGPHLRVQQASWARVGGASALPSSPAPPILEGPSRLPLLISLASGVPILSGPHFSPPSVPPMSYRFTLGCLPSPQASEFPTSAGRHPSCGETVTPRPPTAPS